MTAFDVEAVRRRFSSLETGFGFFDAPGGSQVPDEVGRRSRTRCATRARTSARPTRRAIASSKIVDDAKARGARFFNCSPAEVVFGMNMTTINFALTRVLGRELKEGDEILVTRLDHDGNVAPWVELAEDLGLVIQHVDINADTTLDLADLESKLSERTRVVSFPWASNVIGTLVDAKRVCELAHSVGALAWVDAVHYAAHEPMDVQAIDADVVLCSPYKFCGPHLGMAYVRESLATTWRPYKARPSATTPTARRFETGTLPYELLGGLIATFDYLDDIGGMAAIREYERSLGAALPRRPDGSSDGLRAADDGGPRADLPAEPRGHPGARRRRSRSRRATWASGATTPTTRSGSTRASATTRPCGSASSTTTRPTRSTACSASSRSCSSRHRSAPPRADGVRQARHDRRPGLAHHPRLRQLRRHRLVARVLRAGRVG